MSKGIVTKRILVIAAALVLASFIIGCSQPETETPSPSYDIPRLTCRDVIVMCIEYNDQQLGIESTIPMSERISSGDWNCQYLGNGQWRVTLREPGEGDWVWYVYEKGEIVEFTGMQH